MELRFKVPGEAVGQQRPGRGGGGRWRYDPPRSRNYKAKVRAAAEKAAREAGLDAPLPSPLEIRIFERRRIPTSWSKKRRQDAREGAVLPTTKPDWDNVAKGIQDALSGLIWKDDKQVVRAYVEQTYADEPVVMVEVRSIEKDTQKTPLP